jgi:hypothetical protein
MEKLENKKLSLLQFIISILGLCYSYMTKTPYNYAIVEYFSKNNIDVPTSEYYVDILFFDISLKTSVCCFLTILGLSIYCFIYKTDVQIKTFIHKFYEKIFYYPKKKLNIKRNETYEVLIITLIMIFITVIVSFLMIYKDSLDAKINNREPLTIFESFFLGYGDTFLKITFLTVIIAVVKYFFANYKSKSE